MSAFQIGYSIGSSWRSMDYHTRWLSVGLLVVLVGFVLYQNWSGFDVVRDIACWGAPVC